MAKHNRTPPAVERWLAAGLSILFVIHLSAWWVIPEGLGFNPHPWHLQLPHFIKVAFDLVGIPSTNFGVAITFFYGLPFYFLAGVVLIYRGIKARRSNLNKEN